MRKHLLYYMVGIACFIAGWLLKAREMPPYTVVVEVCHDGEAFVLQRNSDDPKDTYMQTFIVHAWGVSEERLPVKSFPLMGRNDKPGMEDAKPTEVSR